MELKSIYKKSFLYSIGNFSGKIMSALILPLYVVYVTPRQLGYFDFVLTIQMVLTPLFFLGIWESLLKFVLPLGDRGKNEMTSLLSLSVVLSGISFVFLLILFLVVKPVNPLLKYLTIIVPISGIAMFWQYSARSLKKTEAYVVSGVVSTLVNSLGLLFFVCVMKFEAVGLLGAFVLGQISIIIVIESKVNLRKFFSKTIVNDEFIRIALKYSLPLTINLVFGWLMSGFIRGVIYYKMNAEMAGLFSFSSRFSAFVNIIGSVIGMAVIEEALINVKNNSFEKEFENALQGLFETFLVAYLLLIPVIGIFYQIISSSIYSETLICALILPSSSILLCMSTNIGSVFLAKGVPSEIMKTSIVSGLVIIALTVVALLLFESLLVFSVIQVIGSAILLSIRLIKAKCYVNIRLIKIKMSLLMVLNLVLIYLVMRKKLYIDVAVLVVALGFVAFNAYSKIFKKNSAVVR